MSDMLLKIQLTADGKAFVQVMHDAAKAEGEIGQAAKAAASTTGAATRDMQQGFQRTGQAAADLGDKVSSAGNKAKAASTGMSSSARQMTQQFSLAGQAAVNLDAQIESVRRSVLGFLGGLASLHFMREFTASIIEANTKLQGWQYGLLAATGSAPKAQQALAFVRAESERLGISLEDSATAFTRLSAATKGTRIEGEATQKVFTAIAEAARTLHLSSAETQSALIALDQMMSKGTVQAQDLKLQLGNVIPGALHVAADALGVTTQQFDKMMDRGEILSEDFLPKFAARLHEIYGATASEAANAPAAGLQRLKNAWFELRATLGNAGFMDAAAASAQALAEGLKFVANNAEALTGIVTAGLASQLTKLASGFIASRVAAASAAAETAALAADELAAARAAEVEAAAELTKARALAAAGVATTRATAAEVAYAAAQARTAAATEAASVAQVSAASRIGSGLLSLAGGWVGVGIAALAALAYGIAENIKHQEEMQRELEASAKQMTDTAASADDLAASLRGINSIKFAPLPEFKTVFDQWAQGADLAAQQASKLATAQIGLQEAETQLAAVREQMASGTQAGNRALGASYGELQDKVAAYRQEVEILSGPLAALAHSNQELGASLEATLSPALRNAAAAAHSMFDAFGAGDAITRIASVLQQAGVKMGLLKDNAAEWNKAYGDLSQTITDVDAKFSTYGKTTADVLRAQLAALQSTERWKSATDEQRKALLDSANAAIAHASAMEKNTSATKKAASAAQDYVDKLEQANKYRGLTGTALERAQLGDKGLSPGDQKRAEVALDVRDQLDAQDKDARRAADGLRALSAMQAHTTDALTDMKAALSGASQAQIAFNKTQRDAVRDLQAAGGAANAAAKAQYDATIANAAAVRDATEQLANQNSLDQMLQQYEQNSPFKKLADDVDTFKAALEGAFGPQSAAMIERLNKAIGEANYQIAINMVSGTADALRGLQSLTKEGSKDYAALGAAAEAMTAVESILAIVHQATAGDVYSAIPRMIAMAGVLASLGQSISIAGGAGFSDTAAKRQATQGTGTVLGDASAQSESINNALDITAKATSKLVGINTGMLRALQGLQAALGSAAGMLARGAGDADFSGQNLAVGSILNSPFFGATPGLALMQATGGAFDFLHLFSAKSKITDQGIKIMGGTLTDMLNNVMVGAYEEVQSKSWAFGHTHTKEGTAAVSDAFAQQFQLIIQSIVDTVRQGALALGVLPADFEAALAQYKVEETKISLKGLSAEDQQKALEAVFSKIFDGLASAVVPYIEQFQKVGEGLGETLVRVATEVQVMQQAVRYLGLTVSAVDPEEFAQISDELVNMLGGIEDFTTAMTGFVDAFAPDSYKLQLAGDTLTDALSQVNLALPSTRDGMWALMQTLDATTEAGRQQIATLLQLSDTADQYYSLLDKSQQDALQAQQDYANTVAGLQGELGRNPLAAKLLEIGQWSEDTAKKLNDLAKATGATGAAENDLALVREVAIQRMRAAISALMDESQSIADQLGYTSSTADAATSAVSSFGGAMSDAAQKAKDSMQLLLGDLSPYSDQKKLALAKQGLLAGTASREDVLNIGQRYYGSGDDYNQLFNWVMAQQDKSSAAQATAGYKAMTSVDTKTLSKAERYQLADQLANNIADLASAQKISFEDVASQLGLNLSDLGTDLGLGNQALQDYLQVLASDNFGLDDLSGLLHDEVNRLISAITGQAVPDSYDLRIGTTASTTATIPDGSTGGTVHYARAPNTASLVPAPSSAPVTDPAVLEQLKAINARLDALGKTSGVIADNTSRSADATTDGLEEQRGLRRDLTSARLGQPVRRSSLVPT
jgi:tape measure domain-containing protein